VKSTPAFEVVGPAQLSFHPFSEQMAAMIRKNKSRRIVAADMDTITLRTERPKEVLQQVIQQIGEQTGLKLGSAANSRTPPTDPVFFRQAFSDTAVITLLLVPAENGLHRLTCHYIIDERPPGSNDGTPEAISELQELKKQIQGMEAQRKSGAIPPK
jgi:hypothetical protein